ncbi:MAG: hypothetical protein U0031_16475 [Thermomicrobiales bacterium]
MNLHTLARARAMAGNPIGVALIGAGKFGSMFLAQAPTMPGLAVRAITDLFPDRVPGNLRGLGWPDTLVDAVRVSDDATSAIAGDDIDVVVEATGDPIAAVSHALAAIAAGKHVVMVTVEADALVGSALAARAAAANTIYSLAYGDQPALIAELVDWGRACGFRVVAAGKGTRYLPEYHTSTPDTVWHYYGLTAEQARAAGMNSQMFNSFLDGTKSAIEMAAVANSCDLDGAPDGLEFPPCGTEELATVLASRAGEQGFVEVVSSLHRDGSPVNRDLRWGVYVVVEAPSDYSAACFAQYGMVTDPTGRFAALYRPFHLIGMELGISIYSAVLRREATGSPRAFRGDVAAIAKRDLQAGEVLDGEGGYTVWGKLVPARQSMAAGYLPIGFAKNVQLRNDIPAGQVLRLDDVVLAQTGAAYQLRQEVAALVAGGTESPIEQDLSR